MTSLKKNIVRLQLLHFVALSLPLVIQPWLARHLGPFGYGRYVFVTAVIGYFVLLCDFGFGWSATREISVGRADIAERSAIVSRTLLAKVLVCALALVILVLLVATVDEFAKEKSLLFLAFVGALGSAVLPSWYFQGIERPELAMVLEIAGRLICVPVLLLGVTQPDDLKFAIMTLAFGQFAAGAVGFGLLWRDPSFAWITPSLRDIVGTARRAAPLFLSTSAISLYTVSSALVLGFVSSREQVAQFGAAQRLIAAASSVLSPITRVLYPRAGHDMVHRPDNAWRLVGSALWLQGGVGLAASVAIFFFSDSFVLLLFGPGYEAAGDCLRWMSPIPFLLAIAGTFANLVIMAMGRDSLHLLMTLLAALLNVALLIPLATRYGANGAAAALTATELLVMAYAVVVGRRLLRGMTSK